MAKWVHIVYLPGGISDKVGLVYAKFAEASYLPATLPNTLGSIIWKVRSCKNPNSRSKHMQHSTHTPDAAQINLPGESGGSPVTRLSRRDQGICTSLSIVESFFRLVIALEREKMSQESVSTQTISNHTRKDARNTVHTPHTQRTCEITRTLHLIWTHFICINSGACRCPGFFMAVSTRECQNRFGLHQE